MLKHFAPFAILISYFLLSLLFIHPGEVELLKGGTQLALSDGTDSVAFPYIFQKFLDLISDSLVNGLFGAVHFPDLGIPHGSVLWISVIERIQIVLLSFFMPIEQISTGMVVMSMTLNGFFMYLLGKQFKFPKSVAWLLGFAYAFSAYTRARANVHMGLVGLYHFPVVFLALNYLSYKLDKRNLIKASILFLLVSFFPINFVVTIACATPILVWYILRKDFAAIESRRRLIIYTSIALSPAAIWLLFTLIVPVKLSVIEKISPYPNTGETILDHHHYLDFLSLDPVDLLTGDIGLGTQDVLFPRKLLSESIHNKNYEGSNPHERANGLRWIIILIFFASLVYLLPSKKKFWMDNDRSLAILFFVFAFLYFWLALPPNWPVPGAGGSLLLYKILPQMRVPNRFATGITFSVLIIAGLFLKNFLNKFSSKWHRFIFVVLLGTIIFIELPPMLQPLSIAQISPRYPFPNERQECGTGMRYPYVSGKYSSQDYYLFLQKMRGTNCKIINQNQHTKLDKTLYRIFDVPYNFLPTAKLEILKKFVSCANLSWLIIEQPISLERAKHICNQLGWNWSPSRLCSANQTSSDLKSDFEECL